MSFTCSKCEKTFSTQSNLNKHSVNVHNLKPQPITYDKSKFSYKCLEETCNSSFRQNNGLITHLENCHNIQFDVEHLEFPNINEFLVWKALIERTNRSRYFVSSKFKLTERLITYYSCNRSGSHVSRATQRRPKTQGSCKLNRSCTSNIKVVHENKIRVIWTKTHYGHKRDLQHIRIQKDVRMSVASKVLKGEATSRILDSYREVIGGELKRENLITRIDISNIRKSFHIDPDGVGNDTTSVDLWIKEREIEKGHRTAVISHFCIEQIRDCSNKWLVISESNTYWVENVQNRNCCDLKCKECDVCYHMYTCTCNEFMLLTLLCSHIHAVVLKIRTNRSNYEQPEVDFGYLKKNLCFKLSQTFSKLQNFKVETLQSDIINQIEKHIDTIDELLDLSCCPLTFITENSSIELPKKIQTNETSMPKKPKIVVENLKGNSHKSDMITNVIEDHNYALKY